MKRTVFGRRRGVEVPGHTRTFTIEMTKQCIRFRQRNSRKLETVTFERLINSGGIAKKFSNLTYHFTLTEIGLEVRELGKKQIRIVPFEVLINQSNDQPFLFPELLKEPA